ncbi:hypothetical protein J7L06_02205 [Candidatus Bathyarchaeota archaeon]|nr:hypothetical protein [Candidatus Bathyarchaeota archaeon]
MAESYLCLRGVRYSLTVREETAKRVREQARARGLTVDELINEFLTATSRGCLLTCSLLGARIKAGNMQKHMAKVHPKAFRKSSIQNLRYKLARITCE